MIEQMHDALDFLNDAIFEYEKALTRAYPDRTLVPSAVLDAWDKARSYLDETNGGNNG